ncbi:MAG: RNA polymerase sigma factor [Opitutaceae bacterium]|nr:RNA polymerase sigma factor [Opitutaceae bacterium]
MERPPSEIDRWFAAEVQPHEAVLRAWLRARFGNQLEIDDLVQESMARILVARREAELRAPKAFLFAIARNLALDQLRRRGVFAPEPLVESGALFVMDENGDVPEAVARHHDLLLLTEAIQSLPPRCQEIFTLRKIYGLSQKEIAARLGLATSTVSAQLAIGLDRCTDFFARTRRERKGGR